MNSDARKYLSTAVDKYSHLKNFFLLLNGDNFNQFVEKLVKYKQIELNLKFFGLQPIGIIQALFVIYGFARSPQCFLTGIISLKN